VRTECDPGGGHERIPRVRFDGMEGEIDGRISGAGVREDDPGRQGRRPGWPGSLIADRSEEIEPRDGSGRRDP